jgi:hypothetical protein
MAARRKKAPEPAPLPLSPEEQAAADEAWRLYLVDAAAALFYATGGFGKLPQAVAEGRLPRLGDELQPWEIRGWLLPYVMDLRPGVCGRPGRWLYWLRTMEAGKILDEPIPPLTLGFGSGDGSAAGRRSIEKAIAVLGHSHGFSSAPRLIIEWLAWGLHASAEPPRLPAEAAEALYRDFDVCPLLYEPADYLGWMLSEAKGRGHDPSGFFPTPTPLVELMAQVIMDGAGEDLRRKTVNDPCVGTGRMLLVAGGRSLRLSGQDVNPTCVLATLVNGALYCPWLSFPFPAAFFAEEEESPAPAADCFPPSPPPSLGEQGLLFEL